MTPQFWTGKRVFLTGHTGFKGSWLSLWLQHLGATLTGYALQATTQPNLFELAHVAEGMSSEIGDIRDLPALMIAMKSANPEIVIHMAAQPLVRRSYIDPVETYSTNVMGTVHLLEAVRVCPTVRAVVIVTSDKCYDNKEWIWPYRESEPLGGYDPYSSSKGCAELVTSAYRNSFFNHHDSSQNKVAIATARAGNVIGGGDWSADRLVPDALSAFGLVKPVVIRSPNSTRPWQHVLEPLSGYLTLAQRLSEEGQKFAEAFNFGPLPEDSRSVLWIVEKLAKLWGQKAAWKVDTGTHPHEASHLKLDITKAVHQLGWRPRLSLHEALEMTVAWCNCHIRGDDLRSFTNHQIDDYMNRIASTKEKNLFHA